MEDERMHGFTQYTPTRIIFGKETQKQVGELAKSLKASKVFVVYGGGSVVRSGLLDEVTASLEEAGLEYMTVGGVKPNPRLSFAREAVKKSIEFGTDFVLAVGGGSVIDTSKAVAHGTANPDTDIWEFWSKKQTVKKSLPVGVVLTLAAAGSETSDSAVLTNEETKIKRGLSTDFNRPAFAIMNPELTYTLPKYQVGCGIVDIMMHTLDRYFTQTEKNLYAAVLEWPEDGKILIKSLAEGNELYPNKISKVELLGYGKVSFTRTDKGLVVDIPAKSLKNIAPVLKIRK